MSRADFQRVASPQLIAEVRMYDTAAGGRESAASPGWGCPVFPSKSTRLSGWDALPLLRDDPLLPGESRRIGFVFLSGEDAAAALRREGRFYLWEGRFVGEAVIIS